MPSRSSAAAKSAAAVSLCSVFVLVGAGASARAGVIPQFQSATGQAVHTSGGPETTNADGVALLGTGLLPPNTEYGDTITFSTGGSTVARGGMARLGDANGVRVVFASGSGISQNDPAHARGPSTLQFNFSSSWTIDNGTFGPPIGTSFSVPIGLKVGTNGAAGFSASVHWDATVNGVTTTDAREPFVVQMPFGPGKYLTSITAPARPFAFSTLSSVGSNPATIRIYGNLVFAVDNEDSPSLIEFPSFENFGDLPDFAQYDYVPGATAFEVPVPEPTTAGLVGAAVVGLLARRRRRTLSRWG